METKYASLGPEMRRIILSSDTWRMWITWRARVVVRALHYSYLNLIRSSTGHRHSVMAKTFDVTASCRSASTVSRYVDDTQLHVRQRSCHTYSCKNIDVRT